MGSIDVADESIKCEAEYCHSRERIHAEVVKMSTY
jgi:hypothetical protein